MPGVLIEAGLSGVPVVATAAPGVSTIVADGETGMVVAVDDLDAMVEATAGLITDPVRRQTMGQAARRRCVERFSMQTVSRRLARGSPAPAGRPLTPTGRCATGGVRDDAWGRGIDGN